MLFLLGWLKWRSKIEEFLSRKKSINNYEVLLPEAFYTRNNVTRIAQDLIGKAIFTCIDNRLTAGIIVETEAYSWKERGCHAYDNRKTPRNAIMFGEGGNAYVYLCYGMHNLFNVVTNREGKADAVLIRALEPLEGISVMEQRTRQTGRVTSGPGKLTRALGIERKHNGLNLNSKPVWLEDVGVRVQQRHILTSSRIGIAYAGKDAKLPWRYTLKDSLWISK